MADFIVLRLTPAAPVDAATFANYLTGLTINVFDASFATPKAGMPGDPTPPIGSATFNAPAFVGFPAPLPPPPIVNYPAGTTIVQHFTANVSFGPFVTGVDMQSVATAVIPYARAGGGVSQPQSTARSPDSIPARRQPDDRRPRRLLRRADLHGRRVHLHRTNINPLPTPMSARSSRCRPRSTPRSRASICPPTAASPRTTAC